MKELVVLAVVAFCVSCWLMFRPVASGSAAPTEDSMRRIMERGCLACGIPEGEAGEAVQGLAGGFAQRIGVRPDIRAMPPERLLPSLARGDLDAVLWPAGEAVPTARGEGLRIETLPGRVRVIIRSSDRTLAAVAHMFRGPERDAVEGQVARGERRP